MRLLLCVVVSSVVTAGCASTLSSFQTGKPTPRGRVQVHTGVGLYAPVGQVINAIGLGLEEERKIREAVASGEPYEIDEARASNLISAGVSLATFPPAPSYEIALRTGLLETDMDLGFRYSVNAMRLDTKYRFFHRVGGVVEDPMQRTSVDVSIGAAVGRHLFKGPAFEALSFVEMDDFSRTDLEIPLYASFEVGPILKLYAVPKYVFSRTSFDGNLVAASKDVTFRTGLDVTLPSRVDAHFFGATTGIAVGYKYVHLMLELTSGYTSATPVLFGQKRQLGGVTLYPALALAVNFGKEAEEAGGSERAATPQR